jgi:hypothetical protein
MNDDLDQPDIDAMDLPERLAAGVAALRAGRAADAVDLIGRVAESPALAADPDLADVRAAAKSLYASALLADGKPELAERPCRDALGIVRRAGDVDALNRLRALQDRIVAAIAEARQAAARETEAKHVAATPLDTLLANAETAEARAEILVKKSVAVLADGDADGAADLAFRALDVARAAGDVTWQVFARAALLRADTLHADLHLAAGLELASAHEEFNLVSTLLRAAEDAGVSVPQDPGPHTGEEA